MGIDAHLVKGVGRARGPGRSPALSPFMRSSAVHRALFSGAKQLPTFSFLVVKFQDAKGEHTLKLQPSVTHTFSLFWDGLKCFGCIDEASS